MAAASPALAQSLGPTPTPTPTATPTPPPSPSPSPGPSPTPTPTPTATQINSDISTGSTVLNLGSNFLERLGNQATNGFVREARTNPGGGGASEAIDNGPRYRTWGELYGISSSTGPQADYAGDKRRTMGGVAGFGARVMPGVNIGFSVDESRTTIDVPLALQSAKLDLTQFGFNASIDKGPWTWAIALIHGFGNVSSGRDTGFGFASAWYGAQLDGGLTELDYYWTKDQSRIVPKVALEYMHASTGAFQEMGGLDPLTVSGATMDRTRVLVGAEIGHYFILDHQEILDLSAYGKFVDNVSQQFSSVLVSLGPQSITVTGIGESQYGADAGASASLSITNTARLYFNYDGKFRSNLTSHQGTLGLEMKF
ncbi:MAG: autotransporter outer membrane beta-barrel domain-containing protein [Bradyrhizobium sp.]|nr:autotransporter outer membrane beta-barrel domain-containing protein [Bradyrhizobium sp.]